MWLIIASLSGFIAVLAGAVGEHAMQLSNKAYHIYQVANHYQFYHTLLLVFVGYVSLTSTGATKKLSNFCGVLLLVGLLCFPGSLYINALSQQQKVLVLAPIGGICFMLAWLVLVAVAVSLWRHKNGEKQCKQQHS